MVCAAVAYPDSGIRFALLGILFCFHKDTSTIVTSFYYAVSRTVVPDCIIMGYSFRLVWFSASHPFCTFSAGCQDDPCCNEPPRRCCVYVFNKKEVFPPRKYSPVMTNDRFQTAIYTRGRDVTISVIKNSDFHAKWYQRYSADRAVFFDHNAKIGQEDNVRTGIR